MDSVFSSTNFMMKLRERREKDIVPSVHVSR